MPQIGDPIPLTSEQRTALGHECLDLIVALEAENRNLIADKPIWRDWYNATPDTPVRTDPWYGASNLVVPFIRTVADALIANTILTLFATDKLWTGSTENAFYRTRLDSWLDFINYGARHGFPIFEPLHEAVTEMYVHGHAVFQQVWEESEREIVAPNAKRPTTVSLGRGPKTVFWPSEHILYDRELPISEAEAICLQNNMSWAKLTRTARSCGWDEDAVERIRGQQGLEGSAAQAREQKRVQLGLEGQRDYRLEPYDIRELWLDWPLFKSMGPKFNDISGVTIGKHEPRTITVPIIVHLHRKTGTLLHARYNPYLLAEWPFYEIRYRNNDSRGLAKILEHIQRGLTTTANQGIDAVTMGNSLKLLTRDPKLKRQPFVPNQPMHTEDLEGVREIVNLKQVMPEMQLSQMLQAIGERVGGQSDPNFGRETRMGGHPQPATNYLGQRAASQALNTLPMKSLRRAIGKKGEHRSILYQQFEQNRNGWIAKVFDQDDGEKIWEVLNDPQVITGNVRFDVAALSEVHNPDAERQKAVTIDQFYTNYITAVAKMLEVVESPQAQQMPWLREHLIQAIKGKGQNLIRMLEASDVDNIEEYVYELKESQRGDIGNLQQLVAQLSGGGPGGAPGGVPGPVRGRGLAVVPGGAGEGEASAPRPRGRDTIY